MTNPVKRTSFEYDTAGRSSHRCVPDAIAEATPRLVERLSALQRAADEGCLPRVLEIVGYDADQPDAQGHRRRPGLVHDPVEVLVRQGRALPGPFL